MEAARRYYIVHLMLWQLFKLLVAKFDLTVRWFLWMIFDKHEAAR